MQYKWILMKQKMEKRKEKLTNNLNYEKRLIENNMQRRTNTNARDIMLTTYTYIYAYIYLWIIKCKNLFVLSVYISPNNLRDLIIIIARSHLIQIAACFLNISAGHKRMQLCVSNLPKFVWHCVNTICRDRLLFVYRKSVNPSLDINIIQLVLNSLQLCKVPEYFRGSVCFKDNSI